MPEQVRACHYVEWSGKEVALPPLPPLRTGRETFASSGSSRTKAPRERSRFHNGFDPGFSAREAGPLVERTFREVGLPLRVERIGVPPDFDMTPDFGFARIHEAQPNGFTTRGSLVRFGRKRPSSLAQGWEAVLLDPGA
jgi:hypothetical protein